MLNFEELSRRLKAYIRLRINSGEYTERSLARILKVSQPHFHNMLKGVRRPNPQFFDRVMAKFELTVLDLMAEQELFDYLNERDSKWVERALSRKPAGRSDERDPGLDQDSRAAWRTPNSRR